MRAKSIMVIFENRQKYGIKLQLQKMGQYQIHGMQYLQKKFLN